MQVMQIPGVMTDPLGTAPGSRRILFYGGCHAGALATIFREFSNEPGLYFDFITNFEMITNRIPFPYDQIDQWSAVVFSPIAKYAGYETVRLLEACRRAGVPTICYPWLEWRGYFPGTLKQFFLTKPAWQYPTLISAAKRSETFQEYQAWANAIFEDQAFIAEEFDRTTRHLQNQEEMNDCAVRVSGFILENFREERLFLTPDHPAKALYQFVIIQLAKILDIAIDKSFYYSKIEPQYGIKLPIPPGVSGALGLKFFDADYQNNQCFFGGRVFTWSSYLKLCQGIGSDATIYRSNTTTFLKRYPQLSSSLAENDLIKVQQGTVLYAWPAREPTIERHAKLKLGWSDKTFGSRLETWDDVYVFSDHWNTFQPRGNGNLAAPAR